MNNRVVEIIFVLALVVGFMPLALAAPAGASATTNSQDRYDASTAGTTANTEGGNVTNLTITGNAVTNRWAGLYGNINVGVELSDSSGSQFFAWTVTDVTDTIVYAVNGVATPTWATITRAAAPDMPAYVQGSAADSFSNTFTTTGTFSSQSIAGIASVPTVATYDETGSGVGLDFVTFALNDTATGNNIFATNATNNAQGFNNTAVDFQLLVPAQASTTYYFYLELD